MTQSAQPKRYDRKANRQGKPRTVNCWSKQTFPGHAAKAENRNQRDAHYAMQGTQTREGDTHSIEPETEGGPGCAHTPPYETLYHCASSAARHA